MVGDEFPVCIFLGDGLKLRAGTEAGIVYIVNDLGVFAPVVVCAFAVGSDCCLAGAGHHAVKILQRRVVRSHVEVSGKHHRIAFRIYPAYTVDYQLKPFPARLLSHMVKMSVDKIEFPSRLPVFHQRPCRSPVTCGIPAQ